MRAVAEFFANADQFDLWIVNGGSRIYALLSADHPRGHWQILRISRSNRSAVANSAR